MTRVDLPWQILSVHKGEKVDFAPIPIRSGRKGAETRRGWQQVCQKNRASFSTLDNGAPMPYS